MGRPPAAALFVLGCGIVVANGLTLPYREHRGGSSVRPVPSFLPIRSPPACFLGSPAKSLPRQSTVPPLAQQIMDDDGSPAPSFGSNTGARGWWGQQGNLMQMFKFDRLAATMILGLTLLVGPVTAADITP